MYNITIIAGARPNFMKIAPIIHAIENAKKRGEALDYRLVHTGQHYDKNMSGSFFLNSLVFQNRISILNVVVVRKLSKQQRF